jgi:hypothetical protein
MTFPFLGIVQAHDEPYIIINLLTFGTNLARKKPREIRMSKKDWSSKLPRQNFYYPLMRLARKAQKRSLKATF